MKAHHNSPLLLMFILLVITSLACQIGGYSITKDNPTQQPAAVTVLVVTSPPTDAPPATPLPPTETPLPPTIAPTETATAEPPTATPTIAHVSVPPDTSPSGFKVYDVVSKDTSSEKRAPYGDSYQINRLERPFQQDMTYVEDLDLGSYTFSQDKTWTYVSIQSVGSNPNNEISIQYGVELDTDRDGFGDYLILARPPFVPAWTTNVQVYEDKNHDTSGKSSEKSDAPVTTDGYETLVFDGAAGVGDDVDLAWVRINAGLEATVQFAFKKEFPSKTYMVGVFADAGLKDNVKLDYVDRYSEADAGSPVRSNKNYPLKELYLVDNICREAIGFEATGYEPQLCPRAEPTPGVTPEPGSTWVPWFPNFEFFCIRPSYCYGQGYAWDQQACRCNVVVY